MTAVRGHQAKDSEHYDAVLFDLLTALLDSWSLWDDVAGDAEAGRRWRMQYLRVTYAAGRYRPYEQLVGEAAVAAGLPRHLADDLAGRYGEIEPWPEAGAVLSELRGAGIALGVVTNCSEALGRLAAGRVAVPFDAVVTAERAGHYKPDPVPYRLALTELGVAAGRCLFVAGSAYDLIGASGVGMPVWWHDRIGMTPPSHAPSPLARHRTLHPLVAHVLS
jgi:2-haloalkanoic acid dehalogenase type II